MFKESADIWKGILKPKRKVNQTYFFKLPTVDTKITQNFM